MSSCIPMGWPKWRFMNYWRASNPSCFVVLNFYWDRDFIGIVVCNFGVEYLRA